MTPPAQNEAIAKACGWTKFSRGPVYGKDGVDYLLGRKTKSERWISEVPDFTGSLDACHEMEKALDSESKRMAYSSKLGTILNRDTPEHEMTFEWAATAAQKCEAFLRTLNLWHPAQASTQGGKTE